MHLSWRIFIGMHVNGVDLRTAALAIVLVAALVAFWGLVSTLVAIQPWRASAHAAALAAIWFALTILVPATTSHVVNASVPLPSGAQIVRDNREAVHDGWDLDKAETMARFFEHYPEWANTAPVTTPFSWKWYFAFQHLGDLHVESDSQAYTDGIAARERLATHLSWVSLPVVIQRTLLALARTDTLSHQVFQRDVRAYHAQLRLFYYTYLFTNKSMSPDDFSRAPRFHPAS